MGVCLQFRYTAVYKVLLIKSKSASVEKKVEMSRVLLLSKLQVVNLLISHAAFMPDGVHAMSAA